MFRSSVSTLVAVAMLVAIACKAGDTAPTTFTQCAARESGIATPAFHGGRERLGWNEREPALSPERVRTLRSTWTTPPFERIEQGGVTYPGRAYASPLYADGVRIARGDAQGETLSVVIVATSNGDVQAIAAFDAPCKEGTVPAGTTLWRTRLVTASPPSHLDDGLAGSPTHPSIPIGTLSTPVLDQAAGILYVTAMDTTGGTPGLPVWKAFALDVSTGEVRSGWPVVLRRDVVESKNTNGPAFFDDDARFVSQRGGLTLSPDGTRLYLAFGGYWNEAVGWMVGIDTRAPSIVASFAAAHDLLLDKGGVRARHANGGMWAPGGPAVDDAGHVWTTTGNGPVEDAEGRVPHAWSDSMLRLTRDLVLDGAYVPHDYCELDRRKAEIGGASPMLLPELDATSTSTTGVAAFGGKSGVVYLLDWKAVPPPGDVRPPCATSWEDAERDRTLLPPDGAEPYCDGFGRDPCIEPRASVRCVRGPLTVFGPANDDGAVDQAKMRSTPAYFRAADGASYLYVAGSTKERRCAPEVVPPSLVRLRVVTEGGRPAYLRRDAADHELRFVNPGAPVISSDGGRSPVVWVVDQNARRSRALLDPANPPPVLYAVDGTTMEVLFRSSPQDLESGGKYSTPVIAHGVVFVATDRLHAFAGP